jgi:N-succinyldiaminopimelate aminotransferase
MNEHLASLHPYPFEKLACLLSELKPPQGLRNIALSIGEPRHKSPDFVKALLVDNLKHLSSYPTTKGLPSLRQTITDWLTKRYQLQQFNPETHVLPVNGTREAIFSFVQAVVKPIKGKAQQYVVMPNPFYQIYEGAAFLAGAQPYFVNCTAQNNYLGDWDAIPESVWANTQLVFICSPGNPTGTIMPAEKLQKLIELSDRYGFIIASDECYSELYFDLAPVGLLEVCASMGRHDYHNCVVFHSLSKRSNLPGLRSGFIAGDAKILAPYLLYRTYHGSAMPVQHQLASAAAWADEMHVEQNRVLYRQKFDLLVNELGHKFAFKKPDAGFYFWLAVEDDELFAQRLYAAQNITVLPGRYLSREAHGINPGQNHVRIAMVADLEDCIEIVDRLKAL